MVVKCLKSLSRGPSDGDTHVVEIGSDVVHVLSRHERSTPPINDVLRCVNAVLRDPQYSTDFQILATLDKLFWPTDTNPKPHHIPEMELTLPNDAALLGAGGNCKVREGTWGQAEIAVKILPLLDIRRNYLVDALEALLQTCNHPCIARHHGYVRLQNMENRWAFIMEKMTPRTLDALLDDRIGLKERLKFLLQIAKALNYLHAHNIVHRDVKPLNCIFDETGNTAALCDFDTCVIHIPPKARSASIYDLDAVREHFWEPAGTPQFNAPEMNEVDRWIEHLEQRGLDAWKKADVYSFAKTVRLILNGELFDYPEGMRERLQPVGALAWLDDRFPVECACLARETECWFARDPTERPSMREVVRELKALQDKITNTAVLSQ